MAMRSKVFLIGVMILLALTSSACSGVKIEKESLITQEDVTSVSITPIDQISDLRIVALANGAAEIIAAMGYEKNLVGRDIASSVTILARVPIVTSGHQVIPETIISLNPNVVIIDAATGPASAIEKLKSAGIPVAVVSQSWNLPDIARKIQDIGKTIGAAKSAEKLNSAIKVEIIKTKLNLTKKPKILFLYLRGTNAIYLAGGPGSGADSLITTIGGIDIGADVLPNAFNPLSAESMAKLNPDLILLMIGGLQSVGGMKGLLELPGIAQSNAGKNGRVIAVDDSLLLSFGPRTPALLAKLSAAVTSEFTR
jgi:iron complex transport system substrate-binding protein